MGNETCPDHENSRLYGPDYPNPLPGKIHAELAKSSWLRRCFRVVAPETEWSVDYRGYTLGYESVFVDDRRMRSSMSWLWFVPKFEFAVGRRHGVIEIRVWPWLAVRAFTLRIDDQLVYAEGSLKKKKPSPIDSGFDA